MVNNPCKKQREWDENQRPLIDAYLGQASFEKSENQAPNPLTLQYSVLTSTLAGQGYNMAWSDICKVHLDEMMKFI